MKILLAGAALLAAAHAAPLPDWSGVWLPEIADQNKQATTNPPPWNASAKARADELAADDKQGKPTGLFVNCLPEGTPSWALITHNAQEFLFTSDRVTFLGESDGNRLRRIYTDGRPHQKDPDPSFFGDSIGHWEGETLVIDTIGILPEVYIAISEAVGVPNNGDLHVQERVHLVKPDVLADDLTIIAPHVLTKPWHTTRLLHRQSGKASPIEEGVCISGFYSEDKDKQGYATFTPIPQTADGNPKTD